jgi:uncharacterized protein YlzI (FlbEa/FlbD family)
MNTYAKESIKQFLVASSLFLGVLTVSSLTYAGDRGGNGGSGDEVSDLIVRENIKDIVSKIGVFFTRNEKAREEFPEVSFPDLFELTSAVKVEVTDEQLIDKNGVDRTCLNFQENSLILCNKSKFLKLENDVPSQYVLVFHELLGILGVEESSPNREMLESYGTSQKLKRFVTKVSGHDLVYSKGPKSGFHVQTDTGRKKFHTCEVKVIDMPAQNMANFLKFTEGLKKKGYVFTRDITNHYEYWNGKDAGFTFIVDSAHKYTLSPAFYQRMLVMSFTLEVNGTGYSDEITHDNSKKLLPGKKYSIEETIDWALKKIPECKWP